MAKKKIGGGGGGDAGWGLVGGGVGVTDFFNLNFNIMNPNFRLEGGWGGG